MTSEVAVKLGESEFVPTGDLFVSRDNKHLLRPLFREAHPEQRQLLHVADLIPRVIFQLPFTLEMVLSACLGQTLEVTQSPTCVVGAASG